MTLDNERSQIWESLNDPEYRSQFIESEVNVGIAFQIHGLRERQDLNQIQLAERLGGKNKQPLICAWENPNYGKYTLKTLKEFARAFDVGLLVRFVPFSTMIDWAVNLTPDVIAPPNYSEELDYKHLFSLLVPHSKDTPKNIDANANSIDPDISKNLLETLSVTDTIPKKELEPCLKS